MDTLRCQICNRRPAKFVRFKAHQGLIIVRWETEIAGVFCKFHAVEAYKRARSVSFTGMWFGATSLFLGVLRTAWDTISLLDLPNAPVDEPWTIHPAYCPNCSSLIGGYAGVSRCSSCQETVAFCKCARCQTFHAVHVSENAEWRLRCASCGHSTPGSEAIEYSPTILVAYASAELVAAIEHADAFGTQVIDRVLELLSTGLLHSVRSRSVAVEVYPARARSCVASTAVSASWGSRA